MKAPRGYNLIEVMVAGAVFTIGMLAMLPLLSFTVRETARARTLTGAQHVAIELVERLRGEIHWDAGTLTSPTVAADEFWEQDFLPHGQDYSSPTFEVKRGDTTYRVAYALEEPDSGKDCSGNDIDAGLATIPTNSRCAHVRVAWPLPDGRTGRFEMRTLLMGAE